MTSVGVISSTVAGINSLKEFIVNQPENVQKETEQLLTGLGRVKELLVARKAETNLVEDEKEAVQLSYEIVDAIADASSLKSPKDKLFPTNLLHRKKPAEQLLAELQQRLTDLQGYLAETGPRRQREIHNRPLQPQKSSSFFSRMKSPKSSTDNDPAGGLSPQRIPKSGLSPQRKKVDRKPPEASLTRSEQLSTRSSIEEQKSPRRSSGSSEAEPDVTAAGPEKNPIKREELLNLLIQKLKDTESSSEVYLAGESGMGKTTLARRLFQDDQLRNLFKSFAWLPITRNFQINKVFQLLLQQLGPGADQQETKEIDLIPRIFARLQDGPYLLVLDDIESTDDWESIRLALPASKSGKVIITTSNTDVAQDRGEHYLISGLHETEIIALFKDQTASISDEAGKVIFDISGGSPLLATILGKSLQSSVQGKSVAELRSYYVPSVRGTPRVLEASYERLGHELKPHLLYLCQFLAGQDVDIDKLYLLLAAENLIKEEPQISPQSLGKYLKELQGLKLVQVQQDHVVPTRGVYKSCKLHDQVWDFCRSKASEEEFLQIVDYGSSTLEKVGPNTRRLALYLRGDVSAASHESISQDIMKKLWSLVIIDTFEKKSEWPSELNDLTESAYLRILSFDGVDFGVDRKLAKGLDKLVLLKYLSFRGCRLEELPSSLNNLALLETLDLLVRDDCAMVIPNNIFANKKRMLHLYFPRKYQRRDEDGKPKLDLQFMERLTTLINFDTEACDVEALDKLKHLKIFSTTSKGSLDSELFKFLTQEPGKKLQYSAVDITSFDRYDNSSLSQLERLLSCPSVQSIHVEGRIGKLPKEEKGEEMSYADTIGEIVLDGSQLQIDPMTYLGKFQNLHALVLSNDAFVGAEITIYATQFSNLRSLRLHNLKLLKRLIIREDAMPKLSALHIHSSASLSELSVPKEMHERLKRANVDNGGDAYSITPFPSTFWTSPFVFGTST